MQFEEEKNGSTSMKWPTFIPSTKNLIKLKTEFIENSFCLSLKSKINDNCLEEPINLHRKYQVIQVTLKLIVRFRLRMSCSPESGAVWSSYYWISSLKIHCVHQAFYVTACSHKLYSIYKMNICDSVHLSIYHVNLTVCPILKLY